MVCRFMVCRLSTPFVHCALTAEDIGVISFTQHTTAQCLPDRVKIWRTSINFFLPNCATRAATRFKVLYSIRLISLCTNASFYVLTPTVAIWVQL